MESQPTAQPQKKSWAEEQYEERVKLQNKFLDEQMSDSTDSERKSIKIEACKYIDKVNLEVELIIKESKKEIDQTKNKKEAGFLARLWNSNKAVKSVTVASLLVKQNNQLINRGAVFMNHIMKGQKDTLDNLDNAIITSFLRQQKEFESKNSAMREYQQQLAEQWMPSQADAFAKYKEAKTDFDEMGPDTPDKFKQLQKKLLDQAQQRVDEVRNSILQTLKFIRSLIKDVYDLAQGLESSMKLEIQLYKKRLDELKEAKAQVEKDKKSDSNKMMWTAVLGGIAACTVIACSVALYCTGVGAGIGHALLIGGVALGSIAVGAAGYSGYKKHQNQKAYNLDALEQQIVEIQEIIAFNQKMALFYGNMMQEIAVELNKMDKIIADFEQQDKFEGFSDEQFQEVKGIISNVNEASKNDPVSIQVHLCAADKEEYSKIDGSDAFGSDTQAIQKKQNK